MSGVLGSARSLLKEYAVRGALLCTAGLVPKMPLEREAAYTNWRKTFIDLDREEDLELSTTVAESSPNLNRYYNVLAYDQTRVSLTHDGKEIYINANLVKVPAAGREYILTQGPLALGTPTPGAPGTVDDFWLMVAQQGTDCIVMLCNCVETHKEKSAKYWPEEVGDTLLLGENREGVDMEVRLDSEEHHGHYTTRQFTLIDQVQGEERKVEQFHYTDWPDFNVPKSPDCFLEFLLAVRRSGCFAGAGGPPIVHCSAGIGRSGTLCLVDSMLVVAEGGVELTLPMVLDTLMDMRAQRMGLIQTEDQLRFSVDAIVLGVKRLQAAEGGEGGRGGGSKRVKSSDGESGGEEGEGEGEGATSTPEPKKRKASES